MSHVGGPREWLFVMKGTTMGWNNKFRRSAGAAPDRVRNETVTMRVSDGLKPIRSSAQIPPASGDDPDKQIAEEIKRRQVSLAVRYITALRAR
jgi:hypothetical protein